MATMPSGQDIMSIITQLLGQQGPQALTLPRSAPASDDEVAAGVRRLNAQPMPLGPPRGPLTSATPGSMLPGAAPAEPAPPTRPPATGR